MAKRSIGTLSAQQTAKEIQRRRHRDIRWYRSNLPLPPSQPIEAYFIRTCLTLRDVVCLWGADSTPGSDVRELHRQREARWAAIRGADPDFRKADTFPADRRDVTTQRRAARKALLAAFDGKGEWAEVEVPELRVLGVFSELVNAAREKTGDSALQSRRDAGAVGLPARDRQRDRRGPLRPDHPDPEVYVAGELEFILPWLIGYYQDPSEFWCEDAPEEWPEYFDAGRLAPRAGGKPNPALTYTFWTWGLDVMANSIVKSAFDAASERQRAQVLSIPDLRRSFKEGHPPGTRNSSPRTRRPDVKATRTEIRRRALELEETFGPERGNVKRALIERSRSKTDPIPFETLKKRLYRP